MDWTVLKALPIGLVMFTSLVWGVYKRRAGHRHAREDYPALAARLGLVYRPSSSKNQIGQMLGTLRGYSVLVDPDDQRKIIVRFSGTPNLDLRNYESPRRSSQLRYFTFRERVANDFFKTRYVDSDIAERLNAVDVSALLAPFTQRYRYDVKQLNLTEHGVTCVLDFGNPPHIPGVAIEILLPALLDWAEVIEPRPTDND
jgi:hypothetical protein